MTIDVSADDPILTTSMTPYWISLELRSADASHLDRSGNPYADRRHPRLGRAWRGHIGRRTGRPLPGNTLHKIASFWLEGDGFIPAAKVAMIPMTGSADEWNRCPHHDAARSIRRKVVEREHHRHGRHRLSQRRAIMFGLRRGRCQVLKRSATSFLKAAHFRLVAY